MYHSIYPLDRVAVVRLPPDPRDFFGLPAKWLRRGLCGEVFMVQRLTRDDDLTACVFFEKGGTIQPEYAALLPLDCLRPVRYGPLSLHSRKLSGARAGAAALERAFVDDIVDDEVAKDSSSGAASGTLRRRIAAVSAASDTQCVVIAEGDPHPVILPPERGLNMSNAADNLRLARKYAAEHKEIPVSPARMRRRRRP